MGHISAPVRTAQRGRSPELRSLTRLRPLSAPFVQGARSPSGLAPCDPRSGPTLPRPPHPAPRTVTIAKRPSHRDGMKELNPKSVILSRCAQTMCRVMHGLDPCIHHSLKKGWITGASPVMTTADGSACPTLSATVRSAPRHRCRSALNRAAKATLQHRRTLVLVCSGRSPHGNGTGLFVMHRRADIAQDRELST